jgi:hypothetical protein
MLALPLQLFYVHQIFYKVSINLTKISITLLYTRIFGNTRWFRFTCYFIMTATAMYCVSSVAATIFQCTPVPRMWDKTIAGTCINTSQFYYANAGFSIATDVIILFLPMPLVLNLQIPKIQKVALFLVFTLGGFVVVTSCLRLTTLNNNATSQDPTWDIEASMWTVIEMNVAIVCACLPMIRPLIVKVFPKLMRGSSGDKYNHGGAYGAGGASSAAFGGTSKGYIQSRSQDRDGIHMTNIAKGDQSSEEYILHDDKTPQHGTLSAVEATNSSDGSSRNGAKSSTGIQKTVQYSVQYDKEKDSQADWA